MGIIFLLAVTVALPISWFLAELKARPNIRRALGILTLLWSFAIASIVGLLRDFNANVYFTQATKDLLTASVEQLKAGNTASVIREWSRANDQFQPTYENRGNYRKIVDQVVEDIKKP